MREKHDGGAGPIDVRAWLRMLSCTMTIEKSLRRGFAEQYDTTLPRFDVMAALDRHPQGRTMGQLSRALLVSNGNVTAIVRQLQDAGQVVVSPDPEDRRSSIVRLSAAGQASFNVLAEAHHAWIHQALSDVAPDDLEKLHALLAKVKASIGENLHT